MGSSTLVEAEIDAGQRLIAALDGVGRTVDTAFWVLHEDFGDWRFCLNFLEAPRDEIALRKLIRQLLAKFELDRLIESSRIRIVRKGDSYLDALKHDREERSPQQATWRLTRGSIDGVYFDDVVVYRVGAPTEVEPARAGAA